MTDRADWYTDTANARAVWDQRCALYYEETSVLRCHGRSETSSEWKRADANIEAARRNYREWVLGAYRKLCLPITPGKCVPDEVAELLAEEWDERTKTAS